MDVKERLLQAAARLYAEAGYRGATTRRIAMEAGVNELTLFRHFGSKAELLHTAIGSCQAQELDLGLPEAPVDPVAELTAWAEGRLGEMRRHSALIRTALGEVEEHPDLIRPSEHPMACSGELLAAYVGRLRALGMAHGDFDPRAAATMLLSSLIVDALVRDVMPGIFGPDPAHDLSEYVRLFLRGVGVEVREPVRGT
ncbi:MAG TPA: helix-turn-helix domain-containing protein [Gemmatimonadales bacterium]|nr:helix-turn-helix domain-containing protein [Gemmatimonadales bacterium]